MSQLVTYAAVLWSRHERAATSAHLAQSSGIVEMVARPHSPKLASSGMVPFTLAVTRCRVSGTASQTRYGSMRT